jgi:hypothetical protein
MYESFLETHSILFFFTYFAVILAADQSNARSILLYQTNLDKIKKLSSHSAMGVSGPNCDSVNFTEYVSFLVLTISLSSRWISLSHHNLCLSIIITDT